MRYYSRLLVLALSALVLVACQQREDSGQSEKTGTKQSSRTKSSSENKVAPSSSPESEAGKSQEGASSNQSEEKVHHNGQYYSVQGKYGEVIIVNKRYPLSPDYAPGENSEARTALVSLIATMRAQGYSLSDSYSGFRSYEEQAGLYQSYVASDGQANADRYSARPAYSEHQTGLAFDLMDANGALLQDPQASAWLRNHAADYGFIVRYLPDKEAVTGYMAESWHLRYIGEEAKDIQSSGLSLEEYYGVEGGDYSD